jgi:hypothetical protein
MMNPNVSRSYVQLYVAIAIFASLTLLSHRSIDLLFFHQSVKEKVLLGGAPMMHHRHHTTLSSVSSKHQHHQQQPTTNDNKMIRSNNDNDIQVIGIIQCMGEFGNVLRLITLGILFRNFMKDEFQLSATLALHQQTAATRKAKPTFDKIATCFPDFGKVLEFVEPKEEGLDEWVHIKESSSLDAGASVTVIQGQYPFNRTAIQQGLADAKRIQQHEHKKSVIVFYFGKSGDSRNPRYIPNRQELDEYFPYSQEKCCNPSTLSLLEEENLTILHVRGYRIEVSDWKERQLYELDEHRTAYDLLGHLRPNIDKVAILGRFPESVQPWADKLNERNISTTIISGQTDMQDFCLLRFASRTAGNFRSSFFEWATRLNTNLQRCDSYRMWDDSPKLAPTANTTCYRLDKELASRVNCRKYHIDPDRQ